MSPKQKAAKAKKDEDTWLHIDSSIDDRVIHSFRFCPAKTPAVQADLDTNSTPIDCFSTLFTNEIQDDMVKVINDFALFKRNEYVLER